LHTLDYAVDITSVLARPLARKREGASHIASIALPLSASIETHERLILERLVVSVVVEDCRVRSRCCDNLICLIRSSVGDAGIEEGALDLRLVGHLLNVFKDFAMR
jgi:hypothetical protein